MQRLALVAAALALLSGCASPPAGEPAPPTTTAPSTGTPVDTNATLNLTWGDPASRPLRPGITMEHDGAGCTTSFLFQDGNRTFMATAAHCVAGGAPCESGRDLPDKEATLRLTDGSSATARVAYHSWTTMSRVKEKDANTCEGNDFALLELDPADVARAHPASLHFLAPTGLAAAPTDSIWGFGASSLKAGVDQAHPKQGRHLGMAYDGWQHHVYLATPGIPGDSGGHIMTSDGKALGIASTVELAPVTGSNYYTDIAKSLEYMREHEGWAPTILTWDEFHASLV